MSTSRAIVYKWARSSGECFARNIIRAWVGVRCGLSALSIQHIEHRLRSPITDSFCSAVSAICGGHTPDADYLLIVSPGTTRPTSCSMT